MPCKYYKHLMILKKTGAINSRQEKQLFAHLEVCNRCKKLWDQQNETEAIITDLKSKDPFLPHPEELTHRILKSVEQSSKSLWHERFINFLDRVHYYLFFRRMKYALVSIASLLVLIFMLQQFSILNKQWNLERNRNTIRYSKTRKIRNAIQYENINVELSTIDILDDNILNETNMIKLSSADYRMLIDIMMELEKENNQLRIVMKKEYKQLLFKIENEYKQELTREEKTLIQKLKAI